MSTSPDQSSLPMLRRLGSLSTAAAVVVALNALYIALVALGNLTDYDTNKVFVEHVMRMDTTNFGADPGTNLGPDVMWRAADASWLYTTAYLGIIAWEVLTAVVLILAAINWMLLSPNAKPMASIGLMMIVVLFFGGFIGIGGEWYQMWKSAAWNGLEPAFRNAALAAVSLILVHLVPDSAFAQETQATASAKAPNDRST